MRHVVNKTHWANSMTSIIVYANDGDTVVVHSKDMKALAENARRRTYPNKQLIFEVSAEEE